MSQNLKTKSDSMVFNSWITRIDNILSHVPLVTANGHTPLEYSDDEFQQAMKKLQQCEHILKTYLSIQLMSSLHVN